MLATWVKTLYWLTTSINTVVSTDNIFGFKNYDIIVMLALTKLIVIIIIILNIAIIITLFNNNNNNNNNNAQYLARVWFWELLTLALTNVVRVHRTVVWPLLDRLLPARTWFCFERLNLLGTKRQKILNKRVHYFLLWTRKPLNTPNYFDKAQKKEPMFICLTC